MALKKTAAHNPEDAALPSVALRELPRGLDELIAQLPDPDAGVRRRVVRDLAAHQSATPLLAARLDAEPDASVRSALFSSLAQIGGPAVVDAMLKLLRSEDAMLRNAAIEVLSGLPDAVAPRIDALLTDADSDVRIFTVNLLGHLPHPSVPQWLVQVLQHESQANVVGAALDVLAEVGGPELDRPLRQAMARFADEPFITYAAELVLQRIKAP